MTAGPVTVLAGGVGAAKFLQGLVRVTDPAQITVIVNTADDIVLHGLHISPDIDTVTYTLAGENNTESGWGLRDESWQAMAMVSRYGGESWFNLGDRDLGTHLYRTQRLGEGASLSEVTAEICAAWGLGVRLLPVTNDRIETRVTLVGEGEVGFQEYFVGRRHAVAIEGVRFEGAAMSVPAPGVLDAIAGADTIVIAPSNPIVSIGPLLAVPGMKAALSERSSAIVAISPIVGGAALKGPADAMMRDLGMTSSAVGVARNYRDLAGTLVIDEVDRAHRSEIESLGLDCVVTDTIMSDVDKAAALARTVLSHDEVESR